MTAAGSSTITLASSTSVAAAQILTGPGLKYGTTVHSVSGNTVTISKTTNGAVASGATITFEPSTTTLTLAAPTHTTTGAAAAGATAITGLVSTTNVAVAQSLSGVYTQTTGSGVTAKGATTVTLSSATVVTAGQKVAGVGIVGGTSVKVGSSGTTLTLSTGTSAALPAGTTLTFTAIAPGTVVSAWDGTTLTLSKATTGPITAAVTLTFNNVAVGQKVTGTGIDSHTLVKSVDFTTVTISQITTAVISSGTLTFDPLSTTVFLASGANVHPGFTVTGTGLDTLTEVVYVSGTTMTISKATIGPVSGTLTFEHGGVATTWQLADASNVGVGLLVTGTGVISGTHVQAISGTTLVLSKPTSKTIRGATLTFTSGPASQYPTALTLASATDVALGQIVTGTGIATTGGPTTIVAIAGTTISLSRATAATVSSGTLTFVSSGATCLTIGDLTKLTCTIAAAGYYNGGNTGVVSACGTQTPGCGSDTAGTCVLASHGDPSKLQCTTASTSYYANANGVAGLCAVQTGCKAHTATGTTYVQTGSATQDSTTVTLVSAANVVVGMSVIGTGVEEGAYVGAISGTTLTLSIKTMQDIVGGSLTFQAMECMASPGDASLVHCATASDGYWIDGNGAVTACAVQTGCKTSGTVCSVTSGKETELTCTAAADGYFIATGADVPTACTAIANVATSFVASGTAATASTGLMLESAEDVAVGQAISGTGIAASTTVTKLEGNLATLSMKTNAPITTSVVLTLQANFLKCINAAATQALKCAVGYIGSGTYQGDAVPPVTDTCNACVGQTGCGTDAAACLPGPATDRGIASSFTQTANNGLCTLQPACAGPFQLYVVADSSDFGLTKLTLEVNHLQPGPHTKVQVGQMVSGTGIQAGTLITHIDNELAPLVSQVAFDRLQVQVLRTVCFLFPRCKRTCDDWFKLLALCCQLKHALPTTTTGYVRLSNVLSFWMNVNTRMAS